MDKKLKVSLDIDDAGFKSAVKRMQDQLNQIQSGPGLLRQQQEISKKMQQMGLGPMPGTPGNREVEQAQQKAKQQSDKMFEETRRKMEIIKKLQVDLNKEQEKGTITEERRLRIQQQLADLKKQELRTTGELSTLVGLQGKGGGGGGGGAGDLLGGLKGILGVLGISLGAKALFNAGKQAYTAYVSAPQNINQATGSAVQSAVGYQNQSMLSGDLASQALLQGQMSKGRELAQRNFDNQLSNMFSPSRIAGTYLGIQRYGAAYEADRAKTIAEDTVRNAQSLVNQNNNAVLGSSFFNQNFNRNLGAERSLGLGTQGFNRMQMGANNAGFLTDQAIPLLNQIQGAGGSASGANAGPLANLGLGAQRGFNLTNAGNVLGKLTGLYGPTGGGQVDETTKRILEESIRKGFDKSENTEILRRFTETTSELVYQGEAQGGKDVERLARDFGQILGQNPSMKQFEAASGAYQRYQGLTSETGGRGGALGFASFMQGGKFSKLSPLQIGNLQSLPESRITATNSDVVAAAVQQGVSPEEMVKSILQAKSTQALSTVGLSKSQLAPLKKYLGGRDVSALAGNEKELKQLQKTNPAAYSAYMALQQRADLSGSSASDAEKKAMMSELLQGPAGYAQLAGTQKAAERIATGTAGKKEEEYMAAQAAQEKAMVKNLMALQDSLTPTSDSIAHLTQQIIALGNAAQLMTDQERARGTLQGTPTGGLNTKSSLGRTQNNGSKARAGGP